MLRSTLGDEVEGAEVLVISPATNQSKVAFWVSDSDDAIVEAEAAQEETVERLQEAGGEAAGGNRGGRGGGRGPRRRHRRGRAGGRHPGRAGDVPRGPDRGLLAPRGRPRLPRG